MLVSLFNKLADFNKFYAFPLVNAKFARHILNQHRLSQATLFYSDRISRFSKRKLTDDLKQDILDKLKMETSRDSDQFSFRNIVESLSPARRRNLRDILSGRKEKTVNFFKVEREFSLEKKEQMLGFKRSERKQSVTSKSLNLKRKKDSVKVFIKPKSTKEKVKRIKISLID